MAEGRVAVEASDTEVVVLVDARPALLLAQLAEAGDGQVYVTSQSQGGHKVHEPLPETAARSSYRVSNWLTVDADRTSAFVAVTSVDGPSLVVAFNEGVTVWPEHDRDDQIRLGPHEAYFSGLGDAPPNGGVLSAWGAEPAEHAAAAELLDQVAEVMAGARRAEPVEPRQEQAATVEEAEDAHFGRYLLEMLLTGLLITLVLVVALVLIG